MGYSSVEQPRHEDVFAGQAALRDPLLVVVSQARVQRLAVRLDSVRPPVLRYALTRREGLTRLLGDSRAELGSNAVERSIRSITLGPVLPWLCQAISVRLCSSRRFTA